MAHGIKTVLIKKNENLECNNNNNNTKNSNCNKVATSRSNLIIDNCCLNVNNMMMNKNQISTHTVVQSPVNKSLNCGGATMSLTKPATTTSVSGGAKLGSRRIFTPHFKLQVLESYRNDSDCKGNQRATARKYGIHRRQIQKWLQCENNLRSIIANSPQSGKNIIKNISKTTNSSTATSSSSLTSSSSSTTTAAATILQSRLRVSTNTTSQHTNKSEMAIKLEKDVDMSTNYSCFPMHALPSFKSDILPSTKCLTSSASSTAATASMVKYLYVETNQLENNNNNATNDKSPANYYYETPNYSSNYSYYEKSDDLPIDLSCNKPSKHQQLEIAVPTPIYPSQVEMIATTSSSSPSASPPHLTDISNSFMKATNNPIDLTLHPTNNASSSLAQKRKFSVEDSRNNEKKPIKLFKPYLDENFDDVDEDDDDTKKPTDDKQKFPIIWSNHSTFYQEQQYLNGQPVTNNTDYGYYPYCMYYETSPSNYHTLLPPLLPSQASPVSGYDSSTSSIYSFNDNEHDSMNSGAHSPLHSSGHYEATSPLSTTSTMPSSPVNHHHDMIVPAENKVPSPSSSLYDLKFKLFALDCYYKDESCNDVADKCKLVANKLNINCKVVEKWLRQEKDLRHQQQQQQLQILV